MFLIWIKEDINLGKLSDFFLFQIKGFLGSKQNMYYRCSDTVVSFWQHPCPGHFTFGQIKHPSLPPHRYFPISVDLVDPVRSSGGSIKLGWIKAKVELTRASNVRILIPRIRYFSSHPPHLTLATKQTHSNALPTGYHSVHRRTLTLSDPHKGMKDEVGF